MEGLAVADLSFLDRNLQLRVRASKTDQLCKGTSLLLAPSSQPGLCPVSETHKFMRVCPEGPGQFIVHASGRPLTHHQFSGVLCKAILAYGSNPAWFASHSFCVGAATSAAVSGLSHERIMEMGQWCSAGYKGYIRLGQ